MKEKKNNYLLRIGASVLSVLMIFIHVFASYHTVSKAETIYGDHIIEQGENIQYSDVFGAGSWSTHRYSWNGRIIYCIESNKGAPGNRANYGSSYMGDVEGKTTGIDRGLLACAIAHGPGGELDYAGRQWWIDHGRPEIGNNENGMYVVTHIAANYAYAGISSNTREIIYKGVPGDLWGMFDEYMQFLGKVAAGESTYQHDGKPTSWDNFWVEILMPGENTGWQQMAVYAGVQRHYDLPQGVDIVVPVSKSGDEKHSLDGAVYGLFKNDGTEMERITLSGTTTAVGKFEIKITESGKYYVREITAPKGYKKDTEKYEFTVDVSNQNMTTSDIHINIHEKQADVTVSDTPISVTPKIQVRKDGTGGASVRGAVYKMYRMDSSDLSKNPEVASAVIDTPIDGSEENMTGSFNKTFYIEDAGKVFYIKETSAPKYYLLDESVFYFKVVENGEELRLEAYGPSNACVNGSSISVAFSAVTAVSAEKRVFPVNIQIIKTGNSKDPKATLDGAVYSIYRCDSVATAENTKEFIADVILNTESGNKNKATGFSGTILLPGFYFVTETKAPYGYYPDDKKHFFMLSETGVITSDSPIFTVRGNSVTANVEDEEVVRSFTPMIEIVKDGKCNVPGDESDVSKAKFGLFNSKDELLSEIELKGNAVRASGVFSYTIKEVGEYYIKETVAPGNFELDTQKYKFRVSLVDGELISDHKDFVVNASYPERAIVKVHEKPNKYRFDVSILKRAAGTGDYSSVEGAVYGLYDSKDTLIDKTVLQAAEDGAKGEFKDVIFEKEKSGKYYIKEITAPKGFRLNEKKYEFTVSVEDQIITVSDPEIVLVNDSLTVRVSEEAQMGKFRLTKKGEDGFAIEGVKFEVYLKSSLSVNANGQYIFDGKTPVRTVYTYKNGKAESGNLPLGTYIVREVEAPEEYLLKEPFEVQIEEDEQVVELGDVVDENVPVYIRATKMDTGRKTVILKAGTSYTITNSKGKLMEDSKGSSVFVCDESGIITIDCGLKPDTYLIKEVASPKGYKADSEPVKIVVNANLEYVVEKDKHIHDVTFSDSEKTGEIIVTKKGKTLSSYEKDRFVWEEAYLPGAEFEVRAAEDIYAPDGHGKKLLAKDERIDILKTGEDGKNRVSNLPMGKYYLVEIKAPEGYLINSEPIEVVIEDKNPKADKIIEAMTIYNEKQNVVLNLYKYDEETKKPLAGAKFGIYADEDIKNFAGETIVKKGSRIAYGISDKDGRILFDIDLPFNRYLIREEQAPYGYVLNETEFKFSAESPYSHIANVYYKNEWGNVPVKGDVRFVKTGESLTDYKDGKFIYENVGLAGAEFDLYALDVFTYDQATDENGERTRYYKKDEFIKKITTSSGGEAVITNLPIGTYYLKETKAPYGMTVLSEPYAFEIKYKDQNTPKVIQTESIIDNRQKIELHIEKLGSGSNEKLSGGIFGLYAGEDIRNYLGNVVVKSGTKIAEASAKEGIISFDADLPHAKYVVREESAVSGYFDTGRDYILDGSYTSQDIRILGIHLIIYNDKIPGFGRLTLSIGNRKFMKNESNYITGDTEGNGGYSVLIGEEQEIRDSRVFGKMLTLVSFAAAILGLAGAVLLILSKLRMKKKRA